MGGDGSTRWELHRKARAVENCFCVSTVYPRDHQLNKHVGVMRPDKTSRWVIRRYLDDGRDALFEILAPEGEPPVLRITIADVGKNMLDGCARMVEFINTKPNLGGDRWWFQCPLCGRRVSYLYLPPKASRFACRLCHHLTYRSSQNSHPPDPFGSLQRFYAHCYKQMGK